MIKDQFSYSQRWDSIGLDCGYCKNFIGPKKWPDRKKSIKCKKHRISLKFELGKNVGYKEGEWFCYFFSNAGGAAVDALNTFKIIKKQMDKDKIYGGHAHNGYLKEILIQSLSGKK